jgi:hypothetical protein
MKGITNTIIMLMLVLGCYKSQVQAKNVQQGDVNEFNIKNSSESNDVMQDFIIEAVKQKLPIVIDDFITLTDISKSNNKLIHKYEIKGIPKEPLVKEKSKQILFKKGLVRYCIDDLVVKMIRQAFSNGVSNNYYIDNEKIISLDFKPSDCDAK